jgi:hypothetical protein
VRFHQATASDTRWSPPSLATGQKATAVTGCVDFAQQLKKQLQFLEASCGEFDVGNHDEAIRS